MAFPFSIGRYFAPALEKPTKVIYCRDDSAQLVTRFYTQAEGIAPMFPGYEKIVEERILKAQKEGAFENLPGAGQPLRLQEEGHIPEDLRLAHKILKNADCLPPELETRKEIRQTEELLAGMEDTAEKYQTMKKLNFLIMKLNTLRNTSIHLDMDQVYMAKLTDRFSKPGNRGNRGRNHP